jgi:hypothetical protein
MCRPALPAFPAPNPGVGECAVINCSGSIIPDTNVGGSIATINEVSDGHKTTAFRRKGRRQSMLKRFGFY